MPRCRQSATVCGSLRLTSVCLVAWSGPAPLARRLWLGMPHPQSHLNKIQRHASSAFLTSPSSAPSPSPSACSLLHTTRFRSPEDRAAFHRAPSIPAILGNGCPRRVPLSPRRVALSSTSFTSLHFPSHLFTSPRHPAHLSSSELCAPCTCADDQWQRTPRAGRGPPPLRTARTLPRVSECACAAAPPHRHLDGPPPATATAS